MVFEFQKPSCVYDAGSLLVLFSNIRNSGQFLMIHYLLDLMDLCCILVTRREITNVRFSALFVFVVFVLSNKLVSPPSPTA